MQTITRATTTSLSFLFMFGMAEHALGQQPPAAPAPTYYAPGAPPTGAPPAAPSPTPPPPASPAPMMPGAAPPAGPMPPASAPAAGFSGGWSLGSGSGATGTASVPGADATATTPTEADFAQRKQSLKLQNNLYGSTGLLRLSEAGSAAPGTFRLSVIADWFTTSNFLCTDDRPCVNRANIRQTGDTSSHFGSTVALSVTVLNFMEVFGSARAYANSNSLATPTLLQVLGDSVLGLKAFTPADPGQLFRFGGEAQLLMLNQVGGVGPKGGGTGFRIRGLATADLTKPDGQGTPLRLHGNVGYHLDNSGQVVADVESSRKEPITRIERFGLGINRTDFFEWGLGGELVFDAIRPFLSYTMDVPVNRQNYTCRPNGRVTAGFNDACLGSDPGASYFPSRLTLGARAFPYQGFAPLLALDIGITGTSNFMEEVAPTPPWTLYLGVGYAADIEEPPPVVKMQTIEKVTQLPPPPQYIVRGSVHEQNTTTALADATVHIAGRAGGGYTTGPDGKFETNHVEPGAYTFAIKADGYKEGQCSATVTAVAPQPALGSPPSGGLQPPTAPGMIPYQPAPGAAMPGTQPGMIPGAAMPGTQPGAAPSAPTNTPVINVVEVDCPLEALPRVGNIVGKVIDTEGQAGVPNATVVATGSGNRELRMTTDSAGAFRFDGLNPGSVTLKAEADKFFAHAESVEVKSREDARVQIGLSLRPKQASVVVQKNEIVIKKEIHFETDSAGIKGDSMQLMEEIADVIQHAPAIRKIEIQGHTDNTGAPEHNQALSQARAESVRSWLAAHGVDGSRLEAKGYGASRPRMPNITAFNRAQNRRVQFMILDREKEK